MRYEGNRLLEARYLLCSFFLFFGKPNLRKNYFFFYFIELLSDATLHIRDNTDKVVELQKVPNTITTKYKIPQLDFDSQVAVEFCNDLRVHSTYWSGDKESPFVHGKAENHKVLLPLNQKDRNGVNIQIQYKKNI